MDVNAFSACKAAEEGYPGEMGLVLDSHFTKPELIYKDIHLLLADRGSLLIISDMFPGLPKIKQDK